ncbi:MULTISPECIES: Stk1 family PASTA domain-containing Ser/Thr kinase [unclassified Nocardiopsis]|uniref:Stk1 family PASTA domain-containing Ser/Thr kinase n=1 Tax=unclassified Nocardiopsis TaxID=2649073 RepID=UPI00066DBCC3|nr:MULTISPECIES: Stk1 family PASTA domain-containing Ser/Thr kinase [unclassified Nocardiopsis]MBQ1084370.1 Stk1 family PASTA domain-containing Ser/Thr kinase [Nocardiopsis sp. B62]
MDMTTSDPLVGATLDRRYFVESRIAGGGMATVYVAHDLRLDRRLALKVMHPSLAQDPTFVQRFINEAHSVAKLSHPNVVQVFDQGEDQGHVFLAMEYVPGQTLRDLLKEHGRLGPQQALNFMASVLAALGAAHQAGMVHRDVKPENVLISKDGRVKVADFGLARAVEQSNQGLTRTGTLMGTAAYLAPEQIEKGTADARSDVYAAGIMLYELLTGGQPHTGETPIAIAYQHVTEDVPRPSHFLPNLPPEVDGLVTKATERDPRYRPSNAGQYLAKVLEVLRTLPDTGSAPAAPLAPVAPQANSAATMTAPQLIAGGAGPGTENATMVVDMNGADLGRDDYDDDGYDDYPVRGGSWFSRNRLLVVGALVTALVVGVAGWWFLLGRYESVPDVIGLSPEAASEQIRGAGLVVDLSDDTVYSDDAAAGEVGDTDPEVDDRLSPGDTVTVFLSKGPQNVSMPDLVGDDVANALKAMEDLGFDDESVVQEEQDSPDNAPGEVLATSPEAGAEADREGTVTITVSSGIPVPSLAGEKREDAEKTLSDLGLTAEIVEEESENIDEGLVISQSPDTGTNVGPGASVTLTVSSGPPEVDIPDVVGDSVRDARKELEEAGFEVEVERIFGGRVVAHQSHTGSAPEGTKIKLTATPGGIDLGDLDEDDDD